EQREKKIAIIENEFGEVPIDDALLKTGAEKLALAEKIVVMDNGCMCCTIRGDLLSG
ncbi:yciC, partial [Symbiodinium sp. CCMP2456]